MTIIPKITQYLHVELFYLIAEKGFWIIHWLFYDIHKNGPLCFLYIFYYLLQCISRKLISLSPAVFTLFTGNLRVEHPLVIFYRVSLLQVEFVHLIVGEVSVVEARSRLWKQITEEAFIHRGHFSNKLQSQITENFTLNFEDFLLLDSMFSS